MGKSMAFLLPLGLFLGLAALLFYGLGTDPRRVPSPLVGRPAPAFVLPVLGDPERTVSEDWFRDQVTLLNVWASWCVSCRAEHAQLMQLARTLGEIQIIGLNWKDETADALRLLRLSGNPYRVSAEDPDNRVGLDWGVYGAPETFLIDASGIICYKKIGPVGPNTWTVELAPHVNLATKTCKEPG